MSELDDWGGEGGEYDYDFSMLIPKNTVRIKLIVTHNCIEFVNADCKRIAAAVQSRFMINEIIVV